MSTIDALLSQIQEDRDRLYSRDIQMDGGVSLHIELARRISENQRLIAAQLTQQRKEVVPSQAV